MKVPLVATNVGGTSEAVRHRVTGILVTPGDADALAAGIVEMIENEAARREMGHAGRQVILGEYCTVRMVEATAQVIVATAGQTRCMSETVFSHHIGK